ncbi:MAG: serine/threonine-protein kinase [Planctomycetota bacterium]
MYAAEQERPRRVVALKMMRLGATSPVALRRFLAEAEALARLSHPGIAQVFEAGVHREQVGGQPFEVPWFVMELVEGALPLDAYAERARLGIAERVDLLVQICDAVHHGHERGVVHRDLKPANVLVDAQGRAKVIDFGIARAVAPDAEATVTVPGETMGTLRYMSPEQLAGQPADARSDVFALGVLAYELLSGRSPWPSEARGLLELAAARERAPLAPGRVDPRLRGDLEWVLLKALEGEPARRYASAGAFADDLRRHLVHEPVQARPPSAMYRVRKLARRHRAAFAAALVALVTLLAGTAVSTAGWLEARRQRTVAEHRAATAEGVLDFFVETIVTAMPQRRGTQATLVEALEELGPEVDSEFADRPEVAARLHHTLGHAWRSIGRIDLAERHLGRALALLEAGHGDAASRVAARRTLALALHGADRAADAVHEGECAYADALATFGPTHRETLRSADALGLIRIGIGATAAAERLLRTTLADATDTFGAGAPETFAPMKNLAEALRLLDREEEALALLERAHAGLLETLGAAHANTLHAANGRAEVLVSLGRLSEAEPLLRDVLGHRERLGDPNAMHTLLALARLLVEDLRPDEGQDVAERALARSEDSLGPRHTSTFAARFTRAVAIGAQGRFAEAEALFLGMLDDLSDASPATRTAWEAELRRGVDEARALAAEFGSTGSK